MEVTTDHSGKRKKKKREGIIAYRIIFVKFSFGKKREVCFVWFFFKKKSFGIKILFSNFKGCRHFFWDYHSLANWVLCT